MPPILKLIRPHHWTKNLLVFAAYIFSAGWLEPDKTTKILLAVAGFCLLSSATYVINDIFDAPKDRLHPKKKSRPIASGKVTADAAALIGTVLGIAGLALCYAASWEAACGAGAYLVLQAAYNLELKKMAVADVFSIAAGFVLRAVVGALAIMVPVSGWLLLCTGSLALMLGFAKRRSELVSQGAEAGTREVLADYTPELLNGLLTLTAAMSLISYGLYSAISKTAQEHPALAFTLPVVAYAVMRYLRLVYASTDTSEPEILIFKDKHLVLMLIFFFAIAFYAMGDKSKVPFLTL